MQKTVNPLRPSFTLIEMLVVVAIISILAAMLSPSLMKALDSSRTVTCGNNERQIGIGIQLWGQDHDDYAPYAGYNSGQGIGQVLRHDGEDVPKSLMVNAGYVTDLMVFACPIGFAAPEFSWSFNELGWAYTYRYGIDLCGNTGRDGRPYFEWQGGGVFSAKMSRFPSSSDTVVAADGVSFADYLDWGENPPDRDFYSPYGANFAHATLTRTNVLYLDGHAKAILPDIIGTQLPYYHTIFSRTTNK